MTEGDEATDAAALSKRELKALLCYLVHERDGLKVREAQEVLEAEFGLALPLGIVLRALEDLRTERIFSKGSGKMPESFGRYYRRHDPRSKPTWLMHEYLSLGHAVAARLRGSGVTSRAPP